MMADFPALRGKTLVACERVPRFSYREISERWGVDEHASEFDGEAIVFRCDDGDLFAMGYMPDCCASCVIESVNGDLCDLVGAPIVLAEESNSEPPGWVEPEHCDSFTWTFYRLATRKGHVDVRWFGESNGYYSESVTFVLCEEAQ